MNDSRYAAPEILSRGLRLPRDHENEKVSIDMEREKKADVYSFGITIFELVSS